MEDGKADAIYEVLGPNRFVTHYMLHGGAISRCGRFTGEKLAREMVITGPSEEFVCSACKSDRNRDEVRGVDNR